MVSQNIMHMDGMHAKDVEPPPFLDGCRGSRVEGFHMLLETPGSQQKCWQMTWLISKGDQALGRSDMPGAASSAFRSNSFGTWCTLRILASEELSILGHHRLSELIDCTLSPMIQSRKYFPSIYQSFTLHLYYMSCTRSL